MLKATAQAHPNIAFIKYWGNKDETLRLPVNPSLSMNLSGLSTETTLEWDESLQADELILNGKAEGDAILARVSRHLDLIRSHLQISQFARIESHNNFPMGAGIASSAAAFAALTVAAAYASGKDVSERALSALARCGSGSASRSIPTGFVAWHEGSNHETSYAESIAEPDHWDLVDVIAVVSDEHKRVGSQEGHTTAQTSDLQMARVEKARERFDICQAAILTKDFERFAEVVEMDSNLMHAVMMTSRPPLFYWKPASLIIMEQVRRWRQNEGIPVCYTLDAGPNVHCLCLSSAVERVRENLLGLSVTQDIRVASVGKGVTRIFP